VLNFLYDGFNVPIFLRVVCAFQVAAEEKGDGLPEAGGKATFQLLDDIVAAGACFPVNEFNEDASLVNG